MRRIYDYQGYAIEVSVESDFGWQVGCPTLKQRGFVAIVRIFHGGESVALFSPLRFGETVCKTFATEVEALMGGFSSGRKIIDDLFLSSR